MLWAQVAKDKTLAPHSATKNKIQFKTQFQINKVFYSKTVLETSSLHFKSQMRSLEKHRRRRLWIWVVSSNRLYSRKEDTLTNHLIRILNIWVRVRWVLVALIKTHSMETLEAKRAIIDNKIVQTWEAEVELWHLSSKLSSNLWPVRMRSLLNIWIVSMQVNKSQLLTRKHNQDTHLLETWTNQEGSILNIITS